MSNAGHTPVLAEAVRSLLAPQGRSTLVDCTIGRGGHAEMLLQAAGPQARLVGLDVDEDNLRYVKERLGSYGRRVRLFHANFAQLGEVLDAADAPAPDLLLADLGFASTQMDDPERGLSFQQDGPLDMRLDRSMDRTAAELVNQLPEKELADVIYQFGEDRLSRRIARRIVTERQNEPIRTTARLAEIVRQAYPPAQHHRGIHPATRTFQALRIAVNDELAALDTLLAELPRRLVVGGRAGIISFHSLEDRRVKRAFADWAGLGRAEVLARKPVSAEADEVAANPRSRSAKLRVVQRTA